MKLYFSIAIDTSLLLFNQGQSRSYGVRKWVQKPEPSPKNCGKYIVVENIASDFILDTEI